MDIPEDQKELIRRAQKLGALKINFEDPFEWDSGYRMPVYNDLKLLLGDPVMRQFVAKQFIKIIDYESILPEVIASVPIGGVSFGTTLADKFYVPFIFVREEPKTHGTRRQIEGMENIEGKRIVLIEDMISTGRTAAKSVQAIRDAKGSIDWCLSIVDYGFDEANIMFGSLSQPCNKRSILTYEIIADVMRTEKYISKDQQDKLMDWRLDPFGWGEKNGFPKDNTSRV
ncbi:orotate phosphoribosyltransferase [Candidatus Pacearchaeota archaeon]|nr:orotate phosphoribosyltransferase [Candidatus Pacearchaeota archaeon]